MRPTLTTLDRRIIGLAWPALGALIIEPLYNLTDTAIVGHLGRVQLGGLALAATVLNLVGWCAAFLEMATTSSVAFRRARGDHAGATTAATAAYLVALSLGVLLGLFIAFAGPPIAGALGGSGAIEDNARTYLQISAVGMPFLLVTLAGTGHQQGYENTRTPLRIVLIANVVNVVVEIGLVYAAHTGVVGSAWGTVVAQMVAAALFIIAGRPRSTWTAGLPGRREFMLLLRNGVALILRTAALGTALVWSTSIAAQIGPTALAAHQIALQVWLLLALALDALAVPAQVYVGGALGGGRPEEAVAIGARCLRLGLWFSALVGLATTVLAPVLPYVFSSDGGVRHTAALALVVCGALQPFAAVAFVFDGLLLGASDYATLRRSMILALLGFAPLAIATTVNHALGIVGVWLAIACWLAVRCLLLGRRWQSRRWALGPADTDVAAGDIAVAHRHSDLLIER